jgi:hypothetical protein
MDLEQFATNVYYDRTFDCQAAKILPGEYYHTNKDMLIVTVLGSCVSACIRDRTTGLGGMNHFMLPDGGGDASSPVSASARYGTYAMEILINDLLKAGAKRENLEAKVFGGGGAQGLHRHQRRRAQRRLRAELPQGGEDPRGGRRPERHLPAQGVLLPAHRQGAGQEADAKP